MSDRVLTIGRVTTAELAIVVTGAVGLGSPAISSYFESRREQRRFENDRATRDVDELRLLLDRAAQQLQDAGIERGGAYVAFMTQGPKIKQDENANEAVAKFVGELRKLSLIQEQLAIRVGKERDVYRHFHDALEGLLSVSGAVRRVATIGDYTVDLSEANTEMDAGTKRFEEGREAFVRAAQALVGTKLPPS